MANPVPSACCVVLAVVVVVYAQRHSQLESHTQYERVGADVTMKCGSMDWDAAVTWTANGTDIDESHLNGSYLVLKNVDLSQSGQYSCYEGSSWHLKYQTNLRVGMPPKEPVLMCRSNNYPKGFYCSWHLPTPTYIPNSFNISVIHGTKDMVCEKDAVPKNRCHIRYLQLFSTVKYKVTLTVTNPLGKNFTTLTFDEFAIVKPDPPESVVAKPVPNNPRRLEVSWQNPSSWPDPESFPLKFFLRYRPLILDQWQHVELSDGTSHTITDAYAGKEYIIQVAAKDNDIGTWSDWSVAVHATPWTEEPKHLTTEAQITETTSASTSSFMAPPTTKICDKGAVVGSGAMAVCWTAGLVVAAYSVLFIYFVNAPSLTAFPDGYSAGGLKNGFSSKAGKVISIRPSTAAQRSRLPAAPAAPAPLPGRVSSLFDFAHIEDAPRFSPPLRRRTELLPSPGGPRNPSAGPERGDRRPSVPLSSAEGSEPRVPLIQLNPPTPKTCPPPPRPRTEKRGYENGGVVRGMMLQAVVPPYGKRGSPKDWTRSPELSTAWRGWRGARTGAGGVGSWSSPRGWWRGDLVAFTSAMGSRELAGF